MILYQCDPGDLNNQYIDVIENQLFVRIKEYITPTNGAEIKYIESCGFYTNCNICNYFKINKKYSSHNDLLSTEALLFKKKSTKIK